MKQLYYTLFIFSFLFFLPGCVDDPDMDTRLQNAAVPEVGNIEIQDSTATTIRVKAVVKTENGAPLTERGFKYWPKDGENGAKEISDSAETLGKGEYSLQIKGLTNGLIYFITPFATNVKGRAYGDTIKVNTTPGVGSLKTSDVDSTKIKATSAYVEGVITDPGEGALLDYGFYLLFGKDTIATFSKGNKNELQQIEDSIYAYTITTNLKPETIYSVEFFAKNSFGEFTNTTGKKRFVTTSGRPILADTVGYESNYDFVTLRSTLISGGDSDIEEVGFCWSTDKNNKPTIEENDTIKCVLASDNTFTGMMTDLKASTNYYVRAYAINSFGITYSDSTINVVKKRDLPTIFLNDATTYPMEDGYVTVSGELKDKGKSEVTSLVLYYSSTNPSPGPTNNEKRQEFELEKDGKSFNVPLRLKGGTTYYVKAYAKNESGEVSNEGTYSFKTPDLFKTLASFTGTYRQEFNMFSVDNQLFVLGGKIGPNEYLKDLFGYSPDYNQWAPMSSYVEDIIGASVCIYKNSAYVIGGMNQCYSYNANTWVNQSRMNLTGDMKGVINSICFAHNNSIVLIGGEKADIVQDTICYWDGEAWKESANFGIPIKNGVAITVGDSVIVGMGSSDSGINKNLWIHTSEDEGWHVWSPLTTAPSGIGKVTSGIVKDSKLYFVDNKGVIWMYDLKENVWYQCSTSPGLKIAPDEYKIMELNGIIYVLAINSYNDSSFVTYNPIWDIAIEQKNEQN